MWWYYLLFAVAAILTAWMVYSPPKKACGTCPNAAKAIPQES